MNAPAELMTTFSGLYRPVNGKFRWVLDMLLDGQTDGFHGNGANPN
jgi:hypothetical protein